VSKRKKKVAAAPAPPRKRKRKAPKRKHSSAPKRKRKAPKRRKRSSAPRRRSGGSKPGRGFKFEVSRVKLNRGGYDPRGKYFGANTGGEKLYEVRVIDRATDIYTDSHVRARTVSDAKAKVMANMMRSIGSSAPANPAPRRPTVFDHYDRMAPTHRQRLLERERGARRGAHADLGAQIAQVSRAARAASERGDFAEAEALGREAEDLYQQFQRGVH